jgi:hypothetical protein
MLNKFPADIILELGQNLEKAELLNFYAVSRRFRSIMVNLLERNIVVTYEELLEILSFVAEDPYFAPSVDNLYLKCDGDFEWTPNSSFVDVAAIQRKMKMEFSEVRSCLSNPFHHWSYGLFLSKADF